MRSNKRRSPREDIIIEPIGLQHTHNMYAWMCDADVSQNVGLRSAPSLEKTEEWIRRALADNQTFPFAILYEGKHVGNVILDKLDSYLSSIRLSIYIGEQMARGSGVGQEAIRLALKEAFDVLDLHKVWLTVHVFNSRAISAYLRSGFKIEGILRDEFILNDERIDVLYMGCIREIYKQEQGDN